MRRFCLVSSDTVGMKQSSRTDVGLLTCLTVCLATTTTTIIIIIIIIITTTTTTAAALLHFANSLTRGLFLRYWSLGGEINFQTFYFIILGNFPVFAAGVMLSSAFSATETR